MLFPDVILEMAETFSLMLVTVKEISRHEYISFMSTSVHMLYITTPEYTQAPHPCNKQLLNALVQYIPA